MTETNKTTVVIGAGHNGLVCAAYLAKAGRDVLVVEASERVGGAANTREFARGFSVSGCAHLLHLLHPQVASDLALSRHGLTLAATDIDTLALSQSGEHLRMSASSISGGNLSDSDRLNYTDFKTQMLRFANLLGNTFTKRPPRLTNGGWNDNVALLRLAWGMRRLGRNDMRELLRIIAINIFDVLEERFDNELLKGAISFDAVLGTHMGPRTPNSLLTYLYRLTGEAANNGTALTLPRGGLGAVADALAKAAENFGVTIRLNAAVARILVEDGKVTGVELENGERIAAGTVVSNADPKKTFFGLLGAANLEGGFARRIHNIRMRGDAAKLHLALAGLPTFTNVDDNDLGSRMLIAPDLTYVERAFNHSKYGEHSTKPVIEITIPSVHDKTLCAEGKHVMSAVVQYAPYGLRDGWDNTKDAFKNLVIDRIADYAPDIRNHIVASELLTPVDLEREFGMTGGHWHHGELAFDQFLMMRPVPGAAQYAAPVPGLYLCGAGAHPGGGVMGLAGHNAATEVIATGRAA